MATGDNDTTTIIMRNNSFTDSFTPTFPAPDGQEIYVTNYSSTTPVSEVAARSAVLIIITLLSVLGNCIVCITLFRRQYLLTPGNKLVLSLTSTNFAFSVIVMPFVVTSSITEHWYFGEVWCSIAGFLTLLVIGASMLILAGIAFDRYYAIAHPMSYPSVITGFRATVVIIICWVVAAICAAPPLFGGWSRYEFQPRRSGCFPVWRNELGFTLFWTMVCFFAPYFAMIGCYACIFKVARTKLKQGKSYRTPRHSSDDDGSNRQNGDTYSNSFPTTKVIEELSDASFTSPTPPIFGSSSLPYSAVKYYGSQMKAALIVVFIFGILLCTMSPFVVVALIEASQTPPVDEIEATNENSQNSPVSTAAMSVSTCFLYLTCLYYPLVYGLWNTTVCKEMKNLICGHKQKQTNQTIPHKARILSLATHIQDLCMSPGITAVTSGVSHGSNNAHGHYDISVIEKEYEKDRFVTTKRLEAPNSCNNFRHWEIATSSAIGSPSIAAVINGRSDNSNNANGSSLHDQQRQHTRFTCHLAMRDHKLVPPVVAGSKRRHTLHSLPSVAMLETSNGDSQTNFAFHARLGEMRSWSSWDTFHGRHGIGVVEKESEKKESATSEQIEPSVGCGSAGHSINECSTAAIFNTSEEINSTNQSRRYHGSENSASRTKPASRTTSQDRCISGHGNLPNAGCRRKSRRSPGVTQPREREQAPPPKYKDVVCGNIYEEIPKDMSSGFPARRDLPFTVIQTDEAIDRISFQYRENRINAPDIVMDARRSKEPFMPIINGHRIEYITMPMETSEMAKSILLDWVKKRPTMSKRAVEKCVVVGSLPNALFRYDLHSMTEVREIIERYDPYRGESVKQHVESSIDAFDYEITQPTEFGNSENITKLPNTEKIEICKSCNGKQKLKCTKCGGAGSKMCSCCHGDGTEPMTHQDCQQCIGGFELCSKCVQSGSVQCDKCDGRGKVITYKCLKATWTLASDFYIDEMAEIPREKLEIAHGRSIISQKDTCVKPIEEDQLLHESVSSASRWFISRHEQLGAVRKQKQTVKIIPVQEFQCMYKEKYFSFFLVGKENQLYIPKHHKKMLNITFGNFFKNLKS